MFYNNYYKLIFSLTKQGNIANEIKLSKIKNNKNKLNTNLFNSLNNSTFLSIHGTIIDLLSFWQLKYSTCAFPFY